MDSTLPQELQIDEEEDADAKAKAASSWKPQVHFVWDLLLDEVLSPSEGSHASFPEFFRILVDGMSLHLLIHPCSSFQPLSVPRAYTTSFSWLTPPLSLLV